MYPNGFLFILRVPAELFALSLSAMVDDELLQHVHPQQLRLHLTNASSADNSVNSFGLLAIRKDLGRQSCPYCALLLLMAATAKTFLVGSGPIG